MSDLLTDQELERETVKEPAKRWRNKWFYRWRTPHGDGPAKGPGIVWGGRIWPSRDAAETSARHQCATRPYEDEGITYLGAFPVDGGRA